MYKNPQDNILFVRSQFNVKGKTVVSKAINDLAGGQLVYDKMRNSIWFTDARTNSIGRLDIKSGIIQLFAIPTQNSGTMGIVLSPDSKNIWIAEITGNKIASLDLTSNNIDGRKIIEYPYWCLNSPTTRYGTDIFSV